MTFWEKRRLTRCKRVDLKNAFIERYRHAWPVSVQCRVLQVSAARYHAHLARRASDAPRQRLSDEALLVHIKALHAETRSAYGWPRIWRELVARGIAVGKQRVQKLMQLHGIRAKGKRRFKVMWWSSYFGHINRWVEMPIYARRHWVTSTPVWSATARSCRS